MSLYAAYCAETGVKHILEYEYGFATYHLLGPECYIEDIYVIPEQRKSGGASNLAKQVEDIAKAKGCKALLGSVNTKIKDPTTSMKVLLAYGFKFLRADQNGIWFRKEL